MADFLVRRDDLRRWRVDEDEAPVDLQAGQVRLHVERFGLTANNITYGAFGDAMGYWGFFDAPEGWGRIPVWGFGEVTATAAEGVTAGDRFYGYLPMSSFVTLDVQAAPFGFTEVSPQRAALPAFYNRYLLARPDTGFDPELDDANAIMRPLFMTGWLIADLLHEKAAYGASAIVLCSASSKTAFATAFELCGQHLRPSVIGLTAPANRDFTLGLGCYDEVLTYDQVADLPADEGLVLVDMAGDPAVRKAVHEHAGEQLRASIVVGATHWDNASLTDAAPLPGARPEFFFAPARIEERSAELGQAEFLGRAAAAWTAFAPRVSSLLQVRHGEGPDSLARAYEALVDGRADPRTGFVFTL